MTLINLLLERATHKFQEWRDDVIAYPPHEWLDDPREPLFTFMWGDREFGFYAMSITYWSEVLLVSQMFYPLLMLLDCIYLFILCTCFWLNT